MCYSSLSVIMCVNYFLMERLWILGVMNNILYVISTNVYIVPVRHSSPWIHNGSTVIQKSASISHTDRPTTFRRTEECYLSFSSFFEVSVFGVSVLKFIGWIFPQEVVSSLFYTAQIGVTFTI